MTLVKKMIVGIVAVCSIQMAGAQTNASTYTIKPGETLSAIAKKYNVSVGDIMRLNGMHASSKINAGDKIKVPAKPMVNTARERVSSTTTVSQPVTTTPATNEKTHVVTKGETLFGISKKYGITVEQIKTWNHLSTDYAQTGTLLIIRQPDATTKTVASAPVVQKQIEQVTEQPTAQMPTVQKDNNEPTAQQTQQSVKTKTDTTTTVDETTTMPNNSFASAMSMPSNAQVEAANDKATAQQSMAATSYTGEGYFAQQFKDKKNKNLQTVTGVSKTFKTASGWNDGKFYILANNIDAGTIVKVTAENGSAVYAKVLWNLGDMKDNAGINFRVSNATAAALKEDAASFNLTVSY